MTKLVRIENADLSTYRVVVEIRDKRMVDGTLEDVLENVVELNNPCDMTGLECYITSTRYLVIKEA